jgi:hypothetical protein
MTPRSLEKRDTEPVVWVRRHWNDWRDAKYRIADVAGWHMSDVSGGINQSAPRPFIHAYVRCDGMIEGELAHSGSHGPCPHMIKVCVTKKMNKEFWKEIKSAIEAEKVRRGQKFRSD